MPAGKWLPRFAQVCSGAPHRLEGAGGEWRSHRLFFGAGPDRHYRCFDCSLVASSSFPDCLHPQQNHFLRASQPEARQGAYCCTNSAGLQSSTSSELQWQAGHRAALHGSNFLELPPVPDDDLAYSGWWLAHGRCSLPGFRKHVAGWFCSGGGSVSPHLRRFQTATIRRVTDQRDLGLLGLLMVLLFLALIILIRAGSSKAFLLLALRPTMRSFRFRSFAF